MAACNEMRTVVITVLNGAHDVHVSVSSCKRFARVVHRHVPRSSCSFGARPGKVISVQTIRLLTQGQVVKSFEVTNTLADVLLCSLAYNVGDKMAIWAGAQCCPPQFLHELFRTIEPFLVDDKILDELLRRKLSDAFSQNPVKTLPRPIVKEQSKRRNRVREDAKEHKAIDASLGQAYQG